MFILTFTILFVTVFTIIRTLYSHKLVNPNILSIMGIDNIVRNNSKVSSARHVEIRVFSRRQDGSIRGTGCDVRMAIVYPFFVGADEQIFVFT